MHFKNITKSSGDGLDEVGGGEGLCPQLAHAGDPMFADAAGDDVVKMAQVGVHVQGKAVTADAAAADLDADGGDLFWPGTAVYPDAGIPFVTPAANVKSGQGPDDHFFHIAQVLVQVGPGQAAPGKEPFQVENGVADELAGAMIGDVAAPVYPAQGETGVVQFSLVEQQVVEGAAPPQGVGGRVFQQQQGVGLVRVGGAGGDEGFLPFPGGVIFYLSSPLHIYCLHDHILTRYGILRSLVRLVQFWKLN